MSQLRKPKPTVARNQNSISDRIKNKPWEKPGSVLLWPTNQQWMIMIQASLQVRLNQNIQLHLKYSVVTFDINLSQSPKWTWTDLHYQSVELKGMTGQHPSHFYSSQFLNTSLFTSYSEPKHNRDTNISQPPAVQRMMGKLNLLSMWPPTLLRRGFGGRDVHRRFALYLLLAGNFSNERSYLVRETYWVCIDVAQRWRVR